MTENNWRPIDTIPEANLVLVRLPKANRGRPGCEVLMAFRDTLDGSFSWWTNGGPNAGDDMNYAEDEAPTHWQPLPDDIDGFKF